MDTCTFDMIAQYCASKIEDETQRKKVMGALARPALFEEEDRLRKCLFDFSEDELEQFFLNLCHSNSYGRNKKLSQSYVRWLISYYKDLFQFYMVETGRYFPNPFDAARFTSFGELPVEDLSRFTRGTLERLSLSIDEHFEPGEAELTNAVLWLFYSGAFDFTEIVGMKEKDVDLNAGTAQIEDRKIMLKDECIEYLKKNHEIREYKAHRLTNLMMPYHDSYLWFPYRETTPPDNTDAYVYAYAQHQARPEVRVRDIVSKKMAKIRSVCNVYINPDNLYYLGVYDYLVSRAGKLRVRDLLLSDGHTSEAVRNADELQQYLVEYGAKYTSKSRLFVTKGNLRAFL